MTNGISQTGNDISAFVRLKDKGYANELTGDDFDDEEGDDSQPIEHIVDGGGGEGPSEFVTIAHLRQGNDRIGHRSADVGPQNNRNGYTHRQNCSKEKSID